MRCRVWRLARFTRDTAFIALLIALPAVAALVAPLAVGAQQVSKAARIGYLSAKSSIGTSADLRRAFSEGLRDHGWIEGKTILVEER